MRLHDQLRRQALGAAGCSEGPDTPYFIREGGHPLLIEDRLPGISDEIASSYLATRDRLLDLLLHKYKAVFDTILYWPLTEVRKLSMGKGLGKTSEVFSRTFEEYDIARSYLASREGVWRELLLCAPSKRVAKAKKLAFLSLTAESLTGE